jgi:hypothetical protein
MHALTKLYREQHLVSADAMPDCSQTYIQNKRLHTNSVDASSHSAHGLGNGRFSSSGRHLSSILCITAKHQYVSSAKGCQAWATKQQPNKLPHVATSWSNLNTSTTTNRKSPRFDQACCCIHTRSLQQQPSTSQAAHLMSASPARNIHMASLHTQGCAQPAAWMLKLPVHIQQEIKVSLRLC